MKTLKEFDYDLWATEENGKKRYFARVKATHEETEISLEVMRLLLSQEKQMRREYERQQNSGTILSLDTVYDSGDLGEPEWLVDKTQDVENESVMSIVQDEFYKDLTPRQKDIFNMCMVNEIPIRKYAREHGISHVSVLETVEAIRKKYKKYFS